MIRLKYPLQTLINLIICSIIPFLILGPFFPDLIVSISTLFFIYFVFKNKKIKLIFFKPLMIFYIYCILFILISVFIAKDMMLSFESSLFYFRIGIFSCLIWYLIEKEKAFLTYFYYTLYLCFLILVIDGYIQFFNGENLLGIKTSGNRISSFFGDELIMGSYLSRLFPLFFALFLIKKKMKMEIYFIGLLFILADMLIFMSGERSAFFFLNISTIFIIILIREYQKFRLITFTVAMIFIFLLSLFSPNLGKRMFKDPIQDMNIITKNSNTEDSNKIIIFTSSHDSLIRTALNMFKEKPILGHGPKMFREICNDERYATGIKPCDTHPHNFYVQLLAETGIVGFSSLFFCLLYVIYAAMKQFISIILSKERPYTDYQICLLAGFFITVWPLSPSGNFFNNWLMIIYSLPIGFYLQSIYSKKHLEKDLKKL